MSGSTAMCAAGKSRRTTCRYGLTSTLRRREFRGPNRAGLADLRRIRLKGVAFPASLGKAAGDRQRRSSVLAALHPVLEHLQRHRAVILGRLGDCPVVAFLDPDFVRRRAVPRQGQPHQPAGSLTRQLVAVEQHLTEQGLRLMLALLGGKAEPARAIAEIIPRRAGTPEIEPGQIVLR